ncbi:GAF and ANTAR domain-containing protein [Pseudokineococcus marinus]
MTAAVVELAQLLLGDALSAYVHRVVDIAARALPEVDAISITLLDDHGRARTAAMSAPLAALLDERQYATGFGPCLHAATTGDTLQVDPHDPAPAYPDFAALARHHGVKATAALALPLPHHVVGALNLYTTTGPLPPATLERAHTFAAFAAVALANAAAHDDSLRMADQLHQALASRAVIDQAKGILMATYGIDGDEAFTRLSQTSQRTNTKLRDVAADLVSRTRTSNPPSP